MRQCIHIWQKKDQIQKKIDFLTKSKSSFPFAGLSGKFFKFFSLKSICLISFAKEENWKEEEDNFTAEQWDSLKKELTRLVIKYPDAQIVGHRDLDENKFCPSFEVRKYLLNEDIPNYKFQDGLTNEADLEELRDDGVI